MSKGLERLERIKDGNGISYKDLMECFDIIEKELKALEVIEESGCSLEHILLIEKTKNYEEYDAQFDKYLEKRYEPFKFELRKSKEEYDSLKEVLL